MRLMQQLNSSLICSRKSENTLRRRDFMKKRLIFVVAVLMLLSILLPYTAIAATDASSRITVYSQYKKSSGKYYYSYENGFGLRDGTIVSSSSVPGLSGQKDCLAQGGCCLFSYAHAIQWVQGYKASDQLLKDLLKYCVAPSNNHGHNYSVCKKPCFIVCCV